MSNRVLSATLIVAFAVVARKEYASGNWPPRPFRFWGVVTVWSILAVLGTVAPELAAAFAVGAVIAVYLGIVPGTGSTPATGGTNTGNPGTNPAVSGSGAIQQPSATGGAGHGGAIAP